MRHPGDRRLAWAGRRCKVPPRRRPCGGSAVPTQSLAAALTGHHASPKTCAMLSTGKAERARARGLRLISQILLALQILSFGHLLSTGHVTCPEHGDIIHVQHGETSASRQLPYADGHARHSMAAAESTVGADHDECLACADTGRRYLVIGPTPLTFALRGPTRLLHVARAPFFAPVDLILLSPKNSPPLV